MSCYLVENGDIDVMVNAARQYGLLDVPPQKLGDLLLRENVDSYRHCYRHTAEPDLELDGRHYVYTTYRQPLHPIAVLKVVDYYVVASDDNPGWETGVARKVCADLTGAAEGYLSVEELREVEVGDWGYRTKAYRLSPLYDRMPYEFPHVKDAFAFRWAA